MADAAILAYQRMKPCSIKYASSIEKGLTFNRNYLMADGTARTNPGIGNPDIVRPFGEVDEEFSTLFFFDEEDVPYGAIMNFACHHDCSMGKFGCDLSADYSGILSGIMKKEFGSHFVTSFLVGANGNLNCLDVGRGSKIFEVSCAQTIAEALSKAALKHLKEAKDLKVDKLESIKEYVDIAVSSTVCHSCNQIYLGRGFFLYFKTELCIRLAQKAENHSVTQTNGLNANRNGFGKISFFKDNFRIHPLIFYGIWLTYVNTHSLFGNIFNQIFSFFNNFLGKFNSLYVYIFLHSRNNMPWQLSPLLHPQRQKLPEKL